MRIDPNMFADEVWDLIRDYLPDSHRLQVAEELLNVLEYYGINPDHNSVLVDYAG